MDSLKARKNRAWDTSSRHAGFTLVELLVVIAIIGILVALLLPAIQAAREAARRSQCESNLHNAGLAVLNFESARKTLPNGVTYNTANIPDGQFYAFGTNGGKVAVGPNWIIDILPYMEEQALHDKFDPTTLKSPYSLGVNDPTVNSVNYIARGTIIPALICPSDPYTRTLFSGFGGNWARGNYAANVGRGFLGYTGFINGPGDVPNPANLNWANSCARGVMGPNVAVTLRRITDGTTKTLMLGEIRAGINDTDSRGVWALGHAGTSLIAMYGGGSDDDGPNAQFSNADDVYAPGLADSTGVCVARSNGDSVAEGTSGGGTSMDQATIRSKHPGGAHVAMCDGSVTFINDDIETTGCYNAASCCTAWDYMILSADEGKLGTYNGATGGRGAAPACP